MEGGRAGRHVDEDEMVTVLGLVVLREEMDEGVGGTMGGKGDEFEAAGVDD